MPSPKKRKSQAARGEDKHHKKSQKLVRGPAHPKQPPPSAGAPSYADKSDDKAARSKGGGHSRQMGGKPSAHNPKFRGAHSPIPASASPPQSGSGPPPGLSPATAAATADHGPPGCSVRELLWMGKAKAGAAVQVRACLCGCVALCVHVCLIVCMCVAITHPTCAIP